MSHKVVIVTGANTGLGFELSKQLVEKDYEVILACRNKERGEDAVRRIRNLCPNSEGKAIFMQLDLADLGSVREFVSNFKASYSSLAVLVNNAGLVANDRRLTKDGFELTVGTNHLGHFLLTNLLLDLLKSTAAADGEARIVVVTSEAHVFNKERSMLMKLENLDFDDLMLEKDGAYAPFQAYRNSKAMNVMFTHSLHRLLEGTGVTANCICPGMVPSTEIGRENSGCLRCFVACMRPFLACCGVSRSLPRAGGHMQDLCHDPELRGVSGHWFVDGRRREPSEETRDEEKQQMLWAWSCEKCGV